MQATADALVTTLIQARFDDWIATWPGQATRFGIHQHDGRLPDLSRAAKLADIAADHDFVRALEAVDATSLSEDVAFERELALHAARLRLFEDEVVRNWERTTDATEAIGSALFLLVARDFAPLEQRLVSLTSRIEDIPAALQQVRDRLGPDTVRLWLELEGLSAAELPGLLREIVASAARVWAQDSRELLRLRRAAQAAEGALLDYATWVEAQLDAAGERVALGRDELDELVGLRALDDLTTDDILAIGWDQLEAQHEARRAAGREIDPAAQRGRGRGPRQGRRPGRLRSRPERLQGRHVPRPRLHRGARPGHAAA